MAFCNSFAPALTKENHPMDLNAEERQVTSRVINGTGEIISTIEREAVPEMAFGVVGIGSQSDVVFNNFILNAREHPDTCNFNFNFNFDSDVDGWDAAPAQFRDVSHARI